MFLNESDLITTLIPIVASWITTVVVVVWKFDRRITANENKENQHETRIAKCEEDIDKHEKRIDKIEVKIAHG